MEEIMKTQMRWIVIHFTFVVILTVLLFTSSISQAANSALRSVDGSVLENYQKIQQALAADSLKIIPESAAPISKAVRNDPDKLLPAVLAQQADKLSKDQDLKVAREDFKALSATLIAYLEKAKVRTTGYQENYCPMVKASWLQKGKKINNPYVGKSMSGCGETKRSF